MIRRLAIALLCVAACADEYRDAALKRAEESVTAATERASKDASRPVYHFRPPANWMNDPNGTIFHNGYYHLFYQHNPYADVWGHMHWGHARSKDLVHWEHLPIALWPSEDKGEAHVFSGCAAINGDGVPMLFYTSVSSAEKKRPNEQWAAIGDPDLIKWEKHPKNPILGVKSIPFEIGPDWRDPFIFKAEGRTFMVFGADTKDEAIVPIFEAETPQFDKWTYRGILYRQPKSAVEFFECPNFFPLDGKWVLIYSPYKPLRYIIGSLDVSEYVFKSDREATLDSGSFYASNIYQSNATKDQTVLVGWLRGFKEGLGWNGCMSLPRTLSIGADGYLRQIPIPTLATLDAESSPSVMEIDTSIMRTTLSATSRFGLNLDISAGERVEVKLAPKSEGARPILIEIDENGVRVDDLHGEWNGAMRPKFVDVSCYVDRSVFELIVNTSSEINVSTLSFSKIVDHSKDGYELLAQSRGKLRFYVLRGQAESPGGSSPRNMRSIWND